MKEGYHHGNLREALLEQATELARTAGPEGVVVREVARRAGVSHNAAYRHFADRDALLEAIGDEAMLQLAALMERRMDDVTGARERLNAAGRAYVEFALTEPGLFEVAFDGFKLITQEDAYCPPLDGPFALLGRVLDEAVEAGVVAPARRPGAEISCWAAVHGFAVLHYRGPLKPMPPAERDQALTRLLGVLAAGLG